MDKLRHYGICGPTYDWFSSYLNEIYQFVVYNGCESERKYMQCGVPQGSVLGPLLFIIHINDLPSVSNYFMPILFADNTNLFSTGGNINFLVYEMSNEMSNMYSWVKANKLSLNIYKTLFMPILFADDTNLFCTGRNIEFPFNEMNGQKCIFGWKPMSFLCIFITEISFYLSKVFF